MKKDLVLAVTVAVTMFFVTREFFPRHIKETNVIPHIVTQYDTVERLPRWYADSVRQWKRRKATTDTVTLYVSSTVVDTQYYPVEAPVADRPPLWPVLSYHGTASFGDTATVTSLDMRTGRLDISRPVIPGIHTDIEVGKDPEPKLTFAPFPKQKGPSLLYKLKMIGIGFGSCSIYNTVK